MAGISLSGLISGSFDWKSVVDQLIQIDSQPVARLQSEESANVDRLSSFAALKTGITELQSSAKALSDSTLFTARTASLAATGTGWTATASNNAAVGSYSVAVSQLATYARINGSGTISAALNTSSDVTGVTLATMNTSTAVTAGDFTVNGKKVTVALTDSLQDVFGKISTATGGLVTGSYDPATDKITLASGDASEIVLGAANDTSNFLTAVRLSNNGLGTTSSATALGSVSLNSPLASAHLRNGFGAVDGSGNGSFSVNGVSISYNINTDSLSTVLGRITASSAGVTASYDAASDRIVLLNQKTGDFGIGISDTTGGLLGALGLTSGASLVRGKNAQFTINGGSMYTSASNTFDASVHGIAGLSVTATTESTQLVNVGADTGTMKDAIQKFITNFNTVQTYIDSQTQIKKGANGKVTSGILAANHEVTAWASEMRSMAFGAISGLTGTITRLENMGIDFSSTDSTLSIKDSAKLTNALTNNTADVSAFFTTANTGFAAKFNDYVTAKLATGTGGLQIQMDTLNKQNTDIEAQIATLNSRLADERQRLTTAFLAMQNAQSAAQQQQQALTNMFSQKSSSSS
jgi:flagellar hook-associated protein 2